MKKLPVLCICVIAVCFSWSNGLCQSDSIPDFDTTYIKDLSGKLALRIYGVNKFNKFSIKDNDLPHELKYAPNENLNLGVGVNYKWYGLGLAFNFPFINNDNDQYGSTYRFDAQTNVFARKFLIDFYLQFYKGFYIENPESYIEDWDEEFVYPHRNDVVTATFGGSFIYVFNHQIYSAKAVFVQTDLQKKSAGSFLWGGYFSINSLSGDSNFIPRELQEKYNENLFFHNIGVTSLGVSLGYSHIFVLWKKFYASFTFVPGLAVQGFDVSYKDTEKDLSGAFLAGRFLARNAFVYNTEKSFAGITASIDNFSGNTNRNQPANLNFSVGSIRFFYGRRFNIR